MKKILLILAVALLAGLFGLISSVLITGPGALLRTDIGQWFFQDMLTPEPDTTQTRIEIGQIVPAFRVQDFSGQLHTLPKPGHWQVINYWASWCAPCRKEMPLLSELSRKGAGRYVVIGIALDNSADAKRFLAQAPIAFNSFQETPNKQDSSSRMGNAWGVLPFTVLIDPEGRLARRHLGQFDNAPQIQDWLNEGMAGEN